MFLIGDFRQLAQADRNLLFLLPVSAAIGIVAAHVLMYTALKKLGAVISMSAHFASPFLTFCGGVFLFGEQLTAIQWVGGLAVISGSLLVISTYREPVEPKTTS